MEQTKTIVVRRVDPKDVHPWLLNKHYARRLCPISHAFAAFDGEQMVGVVTYGTPLSSTLKTGVCGIEYESDVLELNRLCCESIKNLASFIVGRSLAMLPKPSVVVSYADTGQGHVGFVYQATNFIYTGLSAAFKDPMVKGMEHKHHTTIGDEGRGHESRVEFLRSKYGAENVTKAFSNVAAAGDMMKLQQATDGEISKLQLMERAVKAVGQGVGIEQLSKQLEYANAVSDATGMAFEEIADKLQSAFAKESTKGLEQVGINVKAMKEDLAAGVPYAEAFNKAMAATVDKIGPGLESAADQLDRQKATIEDLKLQIGTALLPVYSGFLGFLSEGLGAIQKLLSSHLSMWQKLAYVASYAQGAEGAATRIYLKGLEAANAAIEETAIAAPKLGEALVMSAENSGEAIKKTNKQAETFRDTLSSMLALAQQFAEQDFNFVAKGEVLQQFQFNKICKIVPRL